MQLENFRVPRLLRLLSILSIVLMGFWHGSSVAALPSQYENSLVKSAYVSYTGDVNGDGRPDILLKAKFKVVIVNYEVSIPILLKWRDSFVLLSNPDGSYTIQLSPSADVLNSSVWQPAKHELIYGDTDGDGSQELLVRALTSGSASLLVTTSGDNGNPTIRQRLNAVDLGGTDLGATGLSVDLLDTDGDGRADLMTSRGVMVQSIFLAGAGGIIVPKRSTTVLPTVAGATVGQFDVSSSGSATYNIPIWMPPGPNGMHPSLGLHYDSNSGRGTAGPGWSLRGLGAISRCNKTFAQDTTPAPIKLAVSDGYCLNGSRLRLTAGSYGMASSTYETEIADFSQTTAYGSVGDGPEYFLVRTKDGLTYEYGNTAGGTNNARVTSSGRSTPYQWLLNKVRDRNGNNYVISYGTGVEGSVGVGIPTRIAYTPTAYGSSSYRYEIEFSYIQDTPDGTRFGYVAGGSTVNNNLLSRITVRKAGANTLRVYSLGYESAPTTSRSRLASIQECATPELTSCIAPTVVTYQDGASGVTQNTIQAVSNAASVKGAFDFNGDGRHDFLYQSGSVLYVTFATPTGYGTPINTGVTVDTNGFFDGSDLVGKGQDDIFASVGGAWRRYSWNGSAFTVAAFSMSITLDEGAAKTALSDINGDGLPDLITVSTNSTKIYSRLNTSLNGIFSLSSSRAVAYSDACADCPFAVYSKTGSGAERKRLDFDGDGRSDVAISGYFGVANRKSWSIKYLSSNGGSFQQLQAIPAVGGLQPLFLNWNEDNCTDYAGDNYINISACDGTPSQRFYFEEDFLGVMDWNADGRSDLLVKTGGNLGVHLSTGGGIGGLISTGLPVESFVIVFDQNGDGLDDLASVGGASGLSVIYRLHNAAGTPPDLATSITDGFGVSFRPIYGSIVQGNYSKGIAAVSPERDIQVPLYVVKQLQASDGIGGTFTKSYVYSDAREDIQGRGFSGFGSTTIFDSRPSSLISKFYYRTAFPYTGLAYAQDVYQYNGVTFVSRSVITSAVKTLSSTVNQQRYFPYVGSISTDSYEVGGAKNGLLVKRSTGSFAYDDYGNQVSSTTTLTDKDEAAPQSPTYNQTWTTIVDTTFAPDILNWCLGIPTESMTTRRAAGSLVEHRYEFTPSYSKCRVSQKIIEPSSPTYKVTIDYAYDSFGNPSSQTVTGINMSGRATSTGWGTTGQFPISRTNALGQTATAEYDDGYGLVKKSTDPNGIATTWVYDAYRRVVGETRPDGTSTTYSYNKCANVNGGCQNGDPNSTVGGVNRLVVTSTVKDANGTAIRDEWAYLDQFRRTIVRKSKTLTGSYSRVGTEYDPFGRLYRRTVPCDSDSCAVSWITNYYDPLDRPTDQARQISAVNGSLQVTNISYLGLTTVVTDSYLKTTTKSMDPNGWLRRSVDHDGYYQSFSYDAFGSVSAVTDSQANTLFSATYDYGIAAFKRQTVDMDLGTRSYVYNALGEVFSSTDANGNTFTQTYDDLSRPLTRVGASEGTATWTWGNSAGSYNIGRLQSLKSTGGTTETYGYDDKGRLNRTQIVAEGSTYVYDVGYHASTGLLDTLTYPASLGSYRVKLQYGYQNGLLNRISDFNNSATVIWQASAMNARGQITQETLGSGLVISSGFDSINGRLATIQAGIGGGSGVQNESYAYDNLGNVTERKNVTANLTETFFYDNLYRLDYSKLNGTTNLDLSYDALGNITTRCEPACGTAWTYHPTKKHAVTQASVGSSTYSYGYDNNGNVISRHGYQITWSKDNYPTLINGANESVAMFYDASFKRWKQVYTQAGVTETTLFIGSFLEKVTKAGVTEWRHSIQANGKSVAVVSLSSPGNVTKIRYMLEDHQGSVAKILSSTGATLVSESFTAFGARRNAATWSGSVSASDLTTINSISRSGYTGHDALGAMGLNHMNGRVQDAITGRFLSADPFISEPGNTQNYNRYSYVYNNPVSLVDPSGFEVGTIPTGGPVIVRPPIQPPNDPIDNGIGDPFFEPNSNTAAGDQLEKILGKAAKAVGKAFKKLFGGLFGGGGGGNRPPPPPAEALAFTKSMAFTDLSARLKNEFRSVIHQELTSDFERKLFDRYLDALGDYSLDTSEAGEMRDFAAGRLGAGRPTTLGEFTYAAHSVSFYGNSDLDQAFGVATVYTDAGGAVVGFRDPYDFDSKSLGVRPLRKEFETRAVGSTAWFFGARPFVICWGVGC